MAGRRSSIRKDPNVPTTRRRAHVQAHASGYHPTEVSLRQHPAHPTVFCHEDGRVFVECVATPSGTQGYLDVLVPGLGSGAKSVRVRRCWLIAETFHGIREPGHVVRHDNGDDGDDRASNLLWGPPVLNSADMVRHGRSQRGVRSSFNRISEETARDLKRRALSGESGSVLARQYGVSPQLVCDIKKGRAWAWL